MSSLEMIEKILVSNGYRKVYPTFDAFWDNQIANAYIVSSGPPEVSDGSDEGVAKRRAEAKAYLEPKYWAS